MGSIKTVAAIDEYRLDDQLPGGHFGLIALDSDQATERDFMNMRPEGVSFYTARVFFGEENTLENLKAVGDRLSEAASLILPSERLDAIAYSCTSGTVALGYEEVARPINQARPGVPVVTPMTAAFSVFDHMGVSRLSLLTPYRRNVSDMMAEYVAEHVYSVLNSVSFLLQNSSDLQRLSLDSIIAGAKQSCHEDAEALFISCTGIRAVDVVERLEKELRKPVFTSNQCMFWECLRHSGYSGSIDGYGSLMRRI